MCQCKGKQLLFIKTPILVVVCVSVKGNNSNITNIHVQQTIELWQVIIIQTIKFIE